MTSCHSSYNPDSDSDSSTDVTGPSGDENAEKEAAGGSTSGGKKPKAKGGTGSHAKEEDKVLLFDLLARLDPKGVSEHKGCHLTV